MVKVLCIAFVCVLLYGVFGESLNKNNNDGGLEMEMDYYENKNREPRKINPKTIQAITKYGAKLLGNAFTYGSVAIGVNQIQKKIDAHELENAERRPLDCNKNHFGCLNGNCWTNCGPRLTSSDYCFTAKGTVEATTKYNIEYIDSKIYSENSGVLYVSETNSSLYNFIPYAKCITNNQCNKCYECASACFSENPANVIPV